MNRFAKTRPTKPIPTFVEMKMGYHEEDWDKEMWDEECARKRREEPSSPPPALKPTPIPKVVRDMANWMRKDGQWRDYLDNQLGVHISSDYQLFLLYLEGADDMPSMWGAPGERPHHKER